MIWILSAMLWYTDVEKPKYSDYNVKVFQSREECHDYLFWNQAEIVTELAIAHGMEDGKALKTWAFFCENRKLHEV